MLAVVASDPRVDEARWADAASLLDRAPTGSASRRLRRRRRLSVLLLVAVLLVTAAVVVAAVVLLGGTATRGEEAPAWQAAVGFVVAGCGLTLQLTALAALWWVARRTRVWRSPLSVLTGAQRKDLLAQVRGGRPLDPARVPLARLLAEQVVGQRTHVVGSLGLGLCFTGLWIASPTAWRAALVCVHALVLAVVWLFVERDARRALRLLRAHPSR